MKKIVILHANPAHIAYFSKFGEVISVSHKDEMIPDADLVVLRGGADVDPSRYGEERDPKCGAPNPSLEEFDIKVLPQYMENKTPIFGFCRGHQNFAVVQGLKLLQHVDQRGSWEHCDKLATKGDNEYNEMPINSTHHQVVKDFEGEYPVVVGRSKEYNTIEALDYREKYPAFTVQWHPEGIHDPLCEKVINELLNN